MHADHPEIHIHSYTHHTLTYIQQQHSGGMITPRIRNWQSFNVTSHTQICTTVRYVMPSTVLLPFPHTYHNTQGSSWWQAKLIYFHGFLNWAVL